MQRDMDLIRELLLKLENIPLKMGAMVILSPRDKEVSVDGFTADQIDYHLRLIREIGFIENPNAQPALGIAFRRLTWEGHDYIDSVRDPEIWAKTKSGALAAGGFTVELLRDLAKGFIKKQIEERTGISL